MANSDKNILITPNTGQSTEPKIEFVGSSSAPITLKVLDDNSLSWEGSQGQLFSITNNLSTGSIFSVNDISGVPSIEVNADGTVSLAEFSGNVGVGTSSPTKKFEVSGSDILVNEIVIGKGPGNQSSNTILGVDALNSNTTGNYNVAVGRGNLKDQTTALKNTAIGFAAGENTTGGENTFVGATAGLGATSGDTGIRNVGIGVESLYSMTNANYNTAVGFGSARAVTSGTENVAIGYLALYSNSTAAKNTAVGFESLRSITNATDSVAVGYKALRANTAEKNVAVGSEAMASNTSGVLNVGIGYKSINSNTVGNANTAVGYQSLVSSSGGGYNNAFGTNSLYSNQTGYFNIGIGTEALFSITTANNNTAVGHQALRNSLTSNNTAVGYKSLYSGSGGANTAFGYESMAKTTSGVSNTALGLQAALENTTGANNVAVGMYSLLSNQTGNSNTAVGYEAALNNTTNDVTAVGFRAAKAGVSVATVAVGYAAAENTTGNYNTAVGYLALNENTTGGSNTAVGFTAGQKQADNIGQTFVGHQAGRGSLTTTPTGDYNTAIGIGAMALYTSANNCVAVGRGALGAEATGNQQTAVGSLALQYSTGAFNTALGFQAGNRGTSIGRSTFAGFQAGMGSTTTSPNGDDNVAIGYQSLFSYATAAGNVAVGNSSLYDLVSGSSNVAVGYRSLYSTEGAGYNTAIGDNALQALTTATYSTAVGYRAGYNLTIGYQNNFLGSSAGYNVQTGPFNTIVGSYTGTSNMTQQTVLSDGSGAVRLWIDNSSRVAVNHSSPWAYLDVRQTSNTYPALLLGNGDSSSGTFNRPQIAFGYNGGDTYRHYIRSRHNSSNSSNALDFYVSNGNQYPSLSSGVVHCLSMVSGKVGIGGTTGPNYELDVNGSVALDADLVVNGNGTGLVFLTSNASIFWTMGISTNNSRLYFQYTGSTSVAWIEDSPAVNQLDFTGQHRSIPAVDTLESFSDKVGLIVVSSGEYNSLGQENITINEALPKVKLSDQRNQKSVYGVVSELEDANSETREYVVGAWGSSMNKKEDDNRLIINSLGEGGIWVCNINGNLENGDYITTCEIPGYGMKQDSEFLANYTVAKITCDCDFDLESTVYICEEFQWEGQTYRKAFVGCTYHCG